MVIFVLMTLSYKALASTDSKQSVRQIAFQIKGGRSCQMNLIPQESPSLETSDQPDYVVTFSGLPLAFKTKTMMALASYLFRSNHERLVSGQGFKMSRKMDILDSTFRLVKALARDEEPERAIQTRVDLAEQNNFVKAISVTDFGSMPPHSSHADGHRFELPPLPVVDTRWTTEEIEIAQAALDVLRGREPGDHLFITYALSMKGAKGWMGVIQGQSMELIIPSRIKGKALLMAQWIGRTHEYLPRLTENGDTFAQIVDLE